jgi:hypothetical protein
VITVERETVLADPPDVVWRRATTVAGINDELWPVLRMTAPRHIRESALTAVVPGERAWRSRLLLLGVVPVGHDDVTLAELGPGHRFRELSPLTGMRHWEHERTVTPHGTGSRLHDRVTFEPGAPLRWIPGSGAVARAVVGALFAHRHRRAAAAAGRRDQ